MSASEEFIGFLGFLENKWREFGASNGAKENSDASDAEFNELVKKTLLAHLDFRINILANPEVERLKGNIRIIISSLRVKDELNHSLNIVLNTDKWDSPFGLALLQGRLIGNPTKLSNFERKLQLESDDVIKARLNSVLQLLLHSNHDEDTGQIVLNVYESYRKMLLRDVRFQCRFSSEVTETLLRNYLIVLCHNKQFDHLSSAIKLYPIHRKFKFVCDLFDGSKADACKVHIAEGFMEDLLQREFKKDKSMQDIRNLSLYIGKMIDIASDPELGEHFNLEKLVFSANTEVASEYYYLAATHLRIRMPNSYSNLVLKLISIGLSHDLSYLEQLKYTTSKYYKMRNDEYVKTHCRIFMALVTLGYIITDYSVRRLCFEAAKVCEPDTDYCERLLGHLPESDDMNSDTSSLDPILLDIRYQVETFQHDIRSRNNVANNFQKSSNAIYETLTYFNHRVTLSEDLKPLEYPGVEKYLKRQAIEDQEHISQTSDLDKCLRDIDNFNDDLSCRFKTMRNFFKSSVLPLKKSLLPSNEKIQSLCREIFLPSGHFKIISNGGLYSEMFSDRLQDLLVESYESYRNRNCSIDSEEHSENFFFDFDESDRSSGDCDIDALYLRGVVPVRMLFNKGLLTHEVENVLLYAIMEKKMKHIPAEFEFYNKNRNVEADENQNQVYAGLIYLLNRPHPEYARLMRLSSALMRFGNVMNYFLDSYIVDATPGRFKFKLKHSKGGKPKPVGSPPPSSSISHEMDTSDTNSNHVKENNDIEMVANGNSAIKAENSLPEVKKQIAALIANKIKKPKPAPATTLNGNETFNVSTDILNIFYNLKRELTALTGKDVFMDLNKVSDVSSTNLILCLQPLESKLQIKLGKTRNGNVDPREKIVEVAMPLQVNGKLVLITEIRDEIEYDKYFDNPTIKTTTYYRFNGALTVESLSHNVKFDLDCRIDNVPCKLKLIFQGVRTSRPRKKPVQTKDSPQASQNGLSTTSTSAVVIQPNMNAFNQQSNSNSNSNIPSTSNNTMMSANTGSVSNIYANPQSCLPAFGTIAAVSSSPYNPQAVHSYTNALSLSSQYSLTPTSAMSSSCLPSNAPNAVNGNHNAPALTAIPTPPPPPPPSPQQTPCSSSSSIMNGTHYRNQTSSVVTQGNHHHQQQQPFPVNYEVNKMQVENNLAMPARVMPKIEIINVEDVNPRTMEARKLSFANPCISIKEENTNGLKSETNNQQENENDPIDFEAAIQKSAVIPKKIIQSPEVQSAHMKKLLLSPPPLHYPSPDLPLIPKSEPIVFKCEQLQNEPAPEQRDLTTPQEFHIRVERTFPSAAEKQKQKSPSFGKSFAPSTHKLTSNVIMQKASMQELNGNRKEASENMVEDFIDLTDDSEDMMKKYSQSRKEPKKSLDITFISCESKPEFVAVPSSSESSENRNRTPLNKLPSCRKYRSAKRSLTAEEKIDVRKCKVHVTDIMQNINDKTMKKDLMIELKPFFSDNLPKIRALNTLDQERIAMEVPSEELPIEDYVDDPYDTTFTIVCQNSVSFLFHEDVFGDGIAKTNEKTSCIKIASHNYKKSAKLTNDINEIVNKFRKLKENNNKSTRARDLISIEDVANIFKKDFSKPLYSDKNHLNFTKNLKNRKKFIRWTPKVSNCSSSNESDKKHAKTIFDDEKNHKSLLYQMSHAIINSLPGMCSMEFFKMPSPLRRSLQIEVVHLKDIKAAASSSESSDVNDGTGNEPINNLHHHGDINNGDALSNATTIHIQKIGQTSISHETETRTLQTSFGSIIKNTYPPATSRILTNEKEKLYKMKQEEGGMKKISLGETSLKGNQNVKIIACTSQQQQHLQQQQQQHQQDLSKGANKNQTLINMLTQQVMVPTNSNRHYIITSAPKSSEMKQETSCTLTSSASASAQMANVNSVRKTIANAVGQSQLVQILNSPPSNFTMKSLNVITSTASATITRPNQVITVSSPSAITSVEGLKAELPNSVKQQGIVQFICKTDGKIIHLTPICNNSAGGGVTKKITYKVDTSGAKGPTILHHANQQIILNNQLRKEENPNILTIIQKQGDNGAPTDKKPGNKSTIVGITTTQSNPTSPICTRSIYEENYAKFIQTPSGSNATNPADMGLLTISSTPISSSSAGGNTFIQKIGKTVIQSSNQILPKFNQAFGKSIFSSASINEQIKGTKVVGATNRETITRSIVNSLSPVTKITTKSELKSADGSLLNLIENENIEKPTAALPTLQSALQGNNLLYARPIGNGKLIASNNNNVLLTALRNSNTNAANNVRIISSLADSMSASNHRTIMTPVRISVPIQIPQLINSVRPQSPGNFRSQIVIATTPTSTSSIAGIPTATTTTLIRPQTSIHNQMGSKLHSLLMGAQSSSLSSSSSSSSLCSSVSTISAATITSSSSLVSSHQEVEIEIPKLTKLEQQQQQKPKKSVDNSTLEQLREFDMVLEQVLERSSVTPNSVSSPPPRPDSASRSSPRKHLNEIAAKKLEIKSSSVSLASDSPNDSPTSSKSLSSVGSSAKAVTPKLQEDEHTAQRILDILANYKEQVRNSPDLNNKPAPRRRANPPTNPPAKRKKMAASSSSSSMKNSKQFGSSSDVMTDNTMGSEEDSSCGVGSGVASTGSMNNSPRGDIDDHTDASMDNNFYMEDAKREIASSPQSSSSSVATSPAHNKFSLNRRLLVTEAKSANTTSSSSNSSNVNSSSSSSSAVDSSSSSKSLIMSSSQSSASNASSATRTSSIGESIERLSAQGSTATAVLMPGNYILPMNVLKSGQHLAILSSNNGQKIIAVPASQLASSASGTSIILQRYVNQINENASAAAAAAAGLGNKTILTTQKGDVDEFKKTLRLQQNLPHIGGGGNKNQQTFYVKPIESIKQEIKSESFEPSSTSSSFVSDKTLITEIIQQQQQLSHNHPQHNFMIKLNETSDPRSSSSIMYMADSVVDSKSFEMSSVKIKSEKMEFDGCIKEEIMDLNHDHELLNSPMLTTKMEVDENTSSNHDGGDIDSGGDGSCHQKLPNFPSILSSCLSKQVATATASVGGGAASRNNTRGFLIDPSSKILMYNDRRQNNIVDKEIFNPKSFSEECADLGVDEPIASDLFPEADLLFDSGSPKFDQINAHDGAIQIKRELENGEVLLQMNYNHNITEPWLNCFDTEDELVDDSHGESGDDAKDSELLKANHF